MDGLLLDTERLFQRVWREIASEYGVTLDESFTAAICGTTGRDEAEVLRRYIPGAEPETLMAEGYRRVTEIERTYVPLKPGAVEILEGMRAAGMPMAVASSSPEEMIRHNLTVAGILDFFSVLVSGAQAARGKPFPDVFLLAAEKLRLPPERCYVFEDSINGVRAGHAAGCATVMVPDMVAPTEEIRPLCALIAPSLGDAWRFISEG